MCFVLRSGFESELFLMEILEKHLQEDGWMRLVFRHGADERVRLERCGVNYLLRQAPWVFQVRTRGLEQGGRETLVTFPACNVVQMRLKGGWRTFFVVHKWYGVNLRDCVRVGSSAFSFQRSGVSDQLSAVRAAGGVEWVCEKAAEWGGERGDRYPSPVPSPSKGR